MSDNELRKRLIVAAYHNPEHRATILKELLGDFQTKQAASVDFGESDRLFDVARERTIAFTEYMRRLRGAADSLGALVSLAEKGRFDRSEQIDVAQMSFDGKQILGTCKSQKGTGSSYKTRISLLPKRGYNCSCPDRERRGGSAGPCKHVLALGRTFWTEELQPELQAVEGALDDVMGTLNLLPNSRVAKTSSEVSTLPTITEFRTGSKKPKKRLQREKKDLFDYWAVQGNDIPYSARTEAEHMIERVLDDMWAEWEKEGYTEDEINAMAFSVAQDEARGDVSHAMYWMSIFEGPRYGLKDMSWRDLPSRF